MNQLIAVAMGGAFGAALRFLVSNGVYQWLGRGFPYGTLTVNVIGSFLIGLMTEALILQRIAISMEYRAAILVGLFGSLTTFSTFSLETLYLIEQGNILKASLNVLVSVFLCIFAVWIGLLLGRTLFMYSGGVVRWMGWVFPYALLLVNAIGAFLIGIVSTILVHKLAISLEYRVILITMTIGLFLTLSGLYLILYLIENGHVLDNNLSVMLGVFMSNVMFCGAALWLGSLAGKQI
jgi:fluoride exporter